MVKLTTKDGREIDVSLDFDKACEYESKHPESSIFLVVRHYTKTLRFTDLATILSLTTYKGTWQDWTKKDGFTADKLFEVINPGLEELGFSSGEDRSAQ